ncbi:unnamed protein product [Peniophora sp. CBMAI 1063]|nr:unnamed protein product [Peniophora sp. CBMAI 1063]
MTMSTTQTVAPPPVNITSRSSKDAAPRLSAPAATAPPHVSSKEAAALADVRRSRHSMPHSGSSPTTHNTHNNNNDKKITRRSSKPIFDWFQRKLAGTVRARRASEGARGQAARAHARENNNKKRPPLPDYNLTRTMSTPSRSGREKRVSQAAVSLDDDARERSTYRSSSAARESLWSPASAAEADEDASVRPLPPSSPPSPAPSRSSSSYLSGPATFRSLAASTKPTTLLSVDLHGGMAHIAQAPPTPTVRAPAHLRGLSTATGVSFAASLAPDASDGTVQAPQLTHHHPRNNPRPSSPPPDNASVLTLASSAFGVPGARPGIVQSADALSISGLSHSHARLDDRASDVWYGPGAGDASVRALRPRSSRRGSWESEMSGWSARMTGGGSMVALGPGTPSVLRDRSVWSSFRPGYDDEDDEEREGSVDEDAGESVEVLEGPGLQMKVQPPTPAANEEHKDEHSLEHETPRHEPAELRDEKPPPLPTHDSQDSTRTAEPVVIAKTDSVPEVERETENVEAKDARDEQSDEEHPGDKTLRQSPSSEPAQPPSGDYFASRSKPSPAFVTAQSDVGTENFVSAPTTPLPLSPPVAG